MVTTIQQVFHPLLFIMCYIIGIDFYPRKQSRSQWIINLSIMYCVTLWFAHVYVLYYIVTTFLINIIGANKVKLMSMHSSIFTSMMFAIMIRYHRKRFVICLKKLAIVDDSLEELGTPKMYHKIHMWLKRVVIGWLIYSISINFYGSVWWMKMTETASEALYIPHILNYPFHINTFMDLLFISVLWYIGTRFDKVNEHTRYLLVKEEQKSGKQIIIHHRYTLYTGNYKRTLWTLMHIHLELCHLAREVNFIFGIQITFEMAFCFYHLTVICHFLCQLIIDEYQEEYISNVSFMYSIYQYFGFAIWALSYLLKFFTVNYMCENVSLKANKIDKIIYELSNTSRYADVCKEICQFMLQTTYHQLKFTGMGFFYLGNSLLRKLCTTMLTYIIILRQMKLHL